MITVEEVLAQIQANRKPDPDNPDKKVYDTKSQKDEVSVMNAMMNDTSYQVNVYNNEGYQGTYNPATSFRNMISGVISDAAKVSKIESDNMVKQYEFNNSQAKDMIDFSKEFFNTYLSKTGRKMSLGGRETSNISLKSTRVAPKDVKYPVKVGEDSNGNGIFEAKVSHLPEYESLTVYGPCPVWVKSKQEEK